jgi:hypothetical protein
MAALERSRAHEGRRVSCEAHLPFQGPAGTGARVSAGSLSTLHNLEQFARQNIV